MIVALSSPLTDPLFAVAEDSKEGAVLDAAPQWASTSIQSKASRFRRCAALGNAR